MSQAEEVLGVNLLEVGGVALTGEIILHFPLSSLHMKCPLLLATEWTLNRLLNYLESSPHPPRPYDFGEAFMPSANIY